MKQLPEFADLRFGVFAFRGYNVKNLGRTPELLEHPAYGSIVENSLREASEIAAEALRRPVDLVTRVRNHGETTGLDSYPEDVALIVGVEMAQMRLLEEFFGVTVGQARWCTGYSLGEAAAVISTGIYQMADLLPVPLSLADDCAELANDVSMGVFFSRGRALDLPAVDRLCLEVSNQGQGIVAISTYLSPNSLLLLGQGESLNLFEKRMPDAFTDRVYLRRNANRWPPMHTPITWQRNIPNRSAAMMQTVPGGFSAPSIPVISMVTGKASYDEQNSREILHRWVDHPQQLWEVVSKILTDGIRTVVHVGPDPNLLPATFRRLSDNVRAQTSVPSWGNLGKRALARMVRRPWLTRLLPSFTALFRAPYVQHINLEDWLLEQKPDAFTPKEADTPSISLASNGNGNGATKSLARSAEEAKGS